MKTNNILPLFVATTLLTACGGGGSSSSTTGGTTTNNGGTTTNNNTTVLADAGSVYSGSRNTVLLTTANSMEFVNLVFGTENINGNISARPQGDAAGAADAASSSVLQLQRELSALAADTIATQRYQARGYSLSKACPGGGSVAASGNLSDTDYTGTLQVTYNQCQSENVLTNGSALLVIHAFDIVRQTPSAYTVSMKGLGVRVDNVPYSVTGTLRTDANPEIGQETLTINQYQLNLSTGKQQLAENVKMVAETSGSTTISGKFCDGTDGCVNTATVTPFQFGDDGVPLEGEMLMNGAANSKIQVIADGYDYSVTPPQRKLRVNVDSNGDGMYEALSSRSESVLKNFSVTVNTAPTAVASTHASIALGGTLALNGTRSTDPEGDFLSYQWTVESAPAGSAAAIVNADNANASFTPDKQGAYEFSLKVTDALGNTDLATANTTVLGLARPLNYSVVDAAYSNKLNRVVTVGSQPDNVLNIINPATGAQQAVPLELPPTSVAISPDGKIAVVGHKGAISQVSLTGETVLNFYDGLGFDVFDIAYGENGVAYATAPANMQWSYLYAIDLATGAVQEESAVGNHLLYGGAHLQLVSSLDAVYTLDSKHSPEDLNHYDVSTTLPVWLNDSPYDGEYELGGIQSNLWATEDGMYLLTAGGTLFQTAAQQGADMRYQRTLSDADGTGHLVFADHSQQAAKFVVVEAGDDGSYSLKTYTSPLLNLQSSLSLSGVTLSGGDEAIKAGFAFFNASGTEHYAILQQGDGYYLMKF
ncbi:PKD domain-containing protein [Candidatus Thiothrix sp. Deng01]|uniref:PKD domain-containing protein n=1 Tax=Candidatus Thiothrix phosphatis TaxID=3112415 RepID=A0ABU6D3B3_9GAMM|nr:PKD domain-containing protein [Candidatus Thiothrix sp. Deng01]MEB4593547.1 PKD domain-containing protein [Candidatus Thiothrix sp. Deng01]